MRVAFLARLSLINLVQTVEIGYAMKTIGIHAAKTHLSRLVEQAAAGEPFLIAKGGKPMVKVIPLDAAESPHPRRLGFMAGQLQVPDDFDRMGSDDIVRLFDAGQ